eukprot:COSAG04_NODE_487_length_13521_cov_4.344360_2_plen_570_part_00
MRLLVSATLLVSVALSTTPSRVVGLVWPTPAHVDASGAELALHPDFSLSAELGLADETRDAAPAASSRLHRTIARMGRVVDQLALEVRAADGHRHSLRQLRVVVTQPSAADEQPPNVETDYSYELTVRNATAELRAPSVFGAIYGLESFAQMLQPSSAGEALVLPHDSIALHDAPAYRWRGVMLDVGRRFFPIDLLHNLMETMAAVKMNVVHLHASDYCRWAVESKQFPELTKTDVTGTSPGFYTQDEIRQLVAFAADRGIRIVPEFDLPGHARALLPLADAGLKFCSFPRKNQVMRDPAGSSLKVLTALLGEMASLFPDDVLNIGADETLIEGGCPANETRTLEAELVQAVVGMNKTAMGWEQLIWAPQPTIINAYAGYTAAQVVAKGHLAVESSADHFYFTHPAGWDPPSTRDRCEYGCAGADGWQMCWHDIGSGVPAANASMVLGGEVSMWTDDYVFPAECDAFVGRVPANGSVLYTRDLDAAFAASVGGLMWPRGFVAAGAFYRFDPQTNVSSDAFSAQMKRLGARLHKRGSLLCPAGCECGYCAACGKPYSDAYKMNGANCTSV